MTFRDWWASRTIKFHAAFVAIYTAAMPVLIGFSADDWETLGLSSRAVLLVMAGLNIVHAAGGFYMRSITGTPLSGRSHHAG